MEQRIQFQARQGVFLMQGKTQSFGLPKFLGPGNSQFLRHWKVPATGRQECLPYFAR